MHADGYVAISTLPNREALAPGFGLLQLTPDSSDLLGGAPS